MHNIKEAELTTTVNQLNTQLKLKEDLKSEVLEKEDLNKSKDCLKVILNKIHNIEHIMSNRQVEIRQEETHSTLPNCNYNTTHLQQSVNLAVDQENIQSYSSIMKNPSRIKQQQKNPTNMSRSALLIKRLANTNITSQ